MKRIVLLHLGLPGGAAGSAPRRRTWRELTDRAGGEYVEISLLGEHRASFSRRPDPWAVLHRRAVPETLAWSPTSLLRALHELRPEALICETARTFHPALLGAAPVVLDFVDRLSVSYRDRAQVARRPDRRLFYHLLAGRHQTLEAAPPAPAVAAGRGDAEALGGVWLPNLVADPGIAPDADPDVDLLFFGSLSYPPNIAACRRLARLWPALQARRPGTTLKIAGRRPTAEILRLASRHGWTLEEDFADLATLCASARLAAAPLEHSAGIQNKVLEAAAHGLAQVVSPAATAGLDAAHPLRTAASDEAFIEEIVALLSSEEERRRLAAAARQWVQASYSPDAWLATARELLKIPWLKLP